MSDPSGLKRGQWSRYCSIDCRKANYHRRNSEFRRLLPGEAVPSGSPRRYVMGHGYIVLRWKIGTRKYVEAYEHRVSDGYVTTSEHVHHENHDRTDNRPENLVPMTADDHLREHADHRRRIDRTLVGQLYRDGMSQPEIAAAIGCNPGTVSRVLAEVGVKALTPRQRYPFPSERDLRAAVATSASAVELAERLSIPLGRARAALTHYGIPSYRAGGHRHASHTGRDAARARRDR